MQRPGEVVRILRAVHAAAAGPAGDAATAAKVLHEDFSGTGAVSREWVRTNADARAIATDLATDALRLGESLAAGEGIGPGRIIWRCADVRPGGENGAANEANATATRADVIFVGNFSIGELHSRAELNDYLRSAKSRLATGGVFVCDTYGGAAAFRTGLVHRTHEGREPGERILYTWEQRSVDPFTMRVENALHFRIEQDGEIVAQHFDAFVYCWRLWSVAELRDAMAEAGLANTTVVRGVADAGGREMPEPAVADAASAEHHIVCVAAR